jgi:hypothetical protein
VQARFITENQNLGASQALGLSTNSHNNLRTWHAKATYYYNQTIGFTAGYFNVNGSGDPLLYGRSQPSTAQTRTVGLSSSITFRSIMAARTSGRGSM